MTRSFVLPEAAAPYEAALVGNYLTAPAVPHDEKLVLNELCTPEAILNRAWVQYADPFTEMALIDKKFAHAIREVMWLHTGEQPIATLSDYFTQDNGDHKSGELFRQMSASARQAELESDYVSLSWSSDPETFHRPSIQGEKRLHFHLTSRNGDLDHLDEVKMPIHELGFVDRRRLAEEYSYVAARFMRDIVAARPELGIVTRDIHPCVLSMEIGDWENLKSPRTLQKIQNLLALAETQYAIISDCIGGEDETGTLLPSDCDPRECVSKASGLDDNTMSVAMLGHFVTQIREADIVPAAQGRRWSDHFKTAITPTKGMAYAGNFSKYDNTLYLNLRFCKFSDLGGAGCAFIQGMPVRVKKGSTPMTPDQLARREEFVRSTTALVMGTVAARATQMLST